MGIQRVVVIGQAVRHHFHLPQFRGKAAQGLDKTRIAVYLHVQAGHNAVIRRPVLVEVPVFLAHFLQGIRDIESVVLLLGIQHQGQVVALFDNIHHAPVLPAVLFLQQRLRTGYLPIIVKQLPPQVGQCYVQIHAREHGHGRNDKGKQSEKESYTFAVFHCLLIVTGR